MRAGDLKERIDLQAKSRTLDGKGGFTVSWVTVASGINAAIWPLKADEQMAEGRSEGIATYRVRIRYRRGLRAEWRVKHGARYYGIVGEPIDLGMAHRFLELRCKGVAP